MFLAAGQGTHGAEALASAEKQKAKKKEQRAAKRWGPRKTQKYMFGFHWVSEVPRRDSWMAARRRPNKLSLRRSLPGTQGKNAECALHALHGAKEALVGKSPSTSSSDSSDS